MLFTEWERGELIKCTWKLVCYFMYLSCVDFFLAKPQNSRIFSKTSEFQNFYGDLYPYLYIPLSPPGLLVWLLVEWINTNTTPGMPSTEGRLSVKSTTRCNSLRLWSGTRFLSTSMINIILDGLDSSRYHSGIMGHWIWEIRWSEMKAGSLYLR
jgi:hypothetical protein